MKVFVSTSTFAEYDKAPLQLLRKKGIAADLNTKKRKLSEEEIAGVLKSGKYTALIAGIEPLTSAVLNSARGLKAISRVGTGLDNVDLDAARRLGIKVFNTPDVLTDAVAELALGLMLSSLRRIALMDRKMREGRWSKEMGGLLRGKKVGIIGFGRIGRRVAELACAFGAEVFFYDMKGSSSRLAKKVSLPALLKAADIISIHSSGKSAAIAAKEFSLMKKGAVLINTSRGAAVEEKSLIKALKSGKLSFAGLDVFNSEPYKGELSRLDNTILTAHAGSYAKESRIKMELEAVENLIKGLK